MKECKDCIWFKGTSVAFISNVYGPVENRKSESFHSQTCLKHNKSIPDDQKPYFSCGYTYKVGGISVEHQRIAALDREKERKWKIAGLASGVR